MEKALLKLPEHERAARRLRLEHAQIMKLDDLDRAAKLGSKCPAGIPSSDADAYCVFPVIASYQPTHATSDVSRKTLLGAALEPADTPPM